MPRCVAWVGTAVLALGSGGPPSLVTGGPPAPGVWWWMILAPIFLGEPRLCTQKMVAKGIDWGGVLVLACRCSGLQVLVAHHPHQWVAVSIGINHCWW